MNRFAALKSLSFAQQFTLLMGIAFLLAGLGGFLPVITILPPSDAPQLEMSSNYGYLLGLFPVNLLHNLFHLSLSFLGFWAFRQHYHALVYCRFLALLLGVLSILGFIPAAQTGWGYFPLFGHDIWLHGLEAIIAAYLGFLRK